MRELESKEGVYSLEGWQLHKEDQFEDGVPNIDSTGVFRGGEGEYRNTNGVPISADTCMIQKPLDISRMTIEWVHGTEDLLFKDLTRNDRFLLHLKFGREMDWAEISESTGMDQRALKERLDLILESIRRSIQVGEFVSPEEILEIEAMI
jgi:hypothetical protein